MSSDRAFHFLEFVAGVDRCYLRILWFNLLIFHQVGLNQAFAMVFLWSRSSIENYLYIAKWSIRSIIRVALLISSFHLWKDVDQAFAVDTQPFRWSRCSIERVVTWGPDVWTHTWNFSWSRVPGSPCNSLFRLLTCLCDILHYYAILCNFKKKQKVKIPFLRPSPSHFPTSLRCAGIDWGSVRRNERGYSQGYCTIDRNWVRISTFISNRNIDKCANTQLPVARNWQEKCDAH